MKKVVRSPFRSVHEDDAKASSNSLRSSSEKESHRNSRRERKPSTNSSDFRVKIPKFEDKFDLDAFIEWLSTAKKIFEYKEISEDKKVKLVALNLRKYVSLWKTNLCARRIGNQKDKIRTSKKMKNKLKSHFLPSY